jgi:hypothetical protein
MNKEFKRMVRLAGLTEIKIVKPRNQKDLELDILEFWDTQQDDAEIWNDESEPEWDTEFFTDNYPEYKGVEDKINTIVKKLKII